MWKTTSTAPTPPDRPPHEPVEPLPPRNPPGDVPNPTPIDEPRAPKPSKTMRGLDLWSGLGGRRPAAAGDTAVESRFAHPQK
jgi:hypothetical protein